MLIRGSDESGKPYERRWFIVALNGDGPQIPCVPAIVLARRLAAGELSGAGAMPCVGMVTLEVYLAELKPFAVTVYEDGGQGRTIGTASAAETADPIC